MKKAHDIMRITTATLITTASAIVVVNMTRSESDGVVVVGKDSVIVSVTTIVNKVAVVILDNANDTVSIIFYNNTCMYVPEVKHTDCSGLGTNCV